MFREVGDEERLRKNQESHSVGFCIRKLIYSCTIVDFVAAVLALVPHSYVIIGDADSSIL